MATADPVAERPFRLVPHAPTQAVTSQQAGGNSMPWPRSGRRWGVRAQRLLVLVVVGACALAQGAARNRDLEALNVIDAFFDGTVSVNQLVNRITFLGAERLATDQLTDKLRRSVDPVRRGSVLDALSQLAVFSDDGEVALLRALNDEPLGNRMSAAKALGRIRSAKAAVKLEPMLGDKATGARREAARALGNIGKPKSGAPLLAAAKIEEELETRAVMLMAVGKAADPKQAPALEVFLESDSESTRLAAAQALCLLGSAKGQAFAKKVLSSSDRFERLQGIRLFEGTALKVAQPLLTPVLDDADHGVRAAAARVLAQAGDASKAEWLLIQSAKLEGSPQTQLAYESEIEKLRISPEARAAILKRAGLP